MLLPILTVRFYYREITVTLKARAHERVQVDTAHKNMSNNRNKTGKRSHKLCCFFCVLNPYLSKSPFRREERRVAFLHGFRELFLLAV